MIAQTLGDLILWGYCVGCAAGGAVLFAIVLFAVVRFGGRAQR